MPTIVGIDHGFSFPLRYFEVHHLEPDWPTFLDDFQKHWPTDAEYTYVDFIRHGSLGEGEARSGSARWRRIVEERAGAKSVFHFDVPGSVAKSSNKTANLQRKRKAVNDFQLLIDLHRPAERQGPGGEAETKQALELAGLDRSRSLKIADIGCGTGASTIVLARELDADITSADFLPEFLDELQTRANDHGVADRITTLNGSMDALPFAAEEFDVIWSEGAVYNMGFEAGISAWSRFLKPGGKLIVSEITWLSATRPTELQSHWETEYPEIDVASAKIGLLERHGYSPEAYFVLPVNCWLENYYRPMQGRFDGFLERHGHSEQAKAVVEAEQHEIALYEKYRDYYSYGVYVAKKV